MMLVRRGTVGHDVLAAAAAAAAIAVGSVLLRQATATAENTARVGLEGIATAGFFELNRSG